MFLRFLYSALVNKTVQALNETLLLMKSTAFKALSIKANVSVTPQETKFANQRHLPTKMLKT